MSVLERTRLPRPRLDTTCAQPADRLLCPGDLVVLVNAYPWHYRFVCNEVGIPCVDHPEAGISRVAPRLVVEQTRLLPHGCTCDVRRESRHLAGCPGIYREFAGHPQVVQVSPMRLPGHKRWLSAAWLRYCPES